MGATKEKRREYNRTYQMKNIRRWDGKEPPPVEKMCCICRDIKESSEFNLNIRTKDGFAARCMDCDKSYMKEYSQLPHVRKRYRKPRSSNANRSAQLKCKYGVDLKWFDEQVIKQDNKCAICNNEFDVSPACVDHDHKTGKIRGIICKKCNMMVGLAGDNSSTLISAANYLGSNNGI